MNVVMNVVQLIFYYDVQRGLKFSCWFPAVLHKLCRKSTTLFPINLNLLIKNDFLTDYYGLVYTKRLFVVTISPKNNQWDDTLCHPIPVDISQASVEMPRWVLLHFPDVVGLQKLFKAVVLLHPLHLFYLCMYRLVVGGSLHVANHAQCHGEAVLIVHHRQL